MPKGSLVRLRPIEPEDADALWRWESDPEVMRWLDDGYLESLAAIRKRIADRATNSFAKVTFGVETLADARLIGVVQLRDAQPETGRAELDIYLGERDCWNGGFGTETMRLICRYGFDKMRLHSIGLGVVVENERARHVYRKVGFVEEGRLRQSFRRDGHWHDMILMGLLEDELLD
ncbi:GNAT family N-acetyltransferase [Actinokineospora sp.]|uniref:GNAT family N-acetyltransferase n=1 Tax=Actinokineospora sp. TaxID=1872133 RepID=UPI0040381C53